jgi:hypothetical protein
MSGQTNSVRRKRPSALASTRLERHRCVPAAATRRGGSDRHPARAIRHRGRFGFVEWTPLSREEIDSMIATALADYDEEVRAAWGRIC